MTATTAPTLYVALRATAAAAAALIERARDDLPDALTLDPHTGVLYLHVDDAARADRIARLLGLTRRPDVGLLAPWHHYEGTVALDELASSVMVEMTAPSRAARRAAVLDDVLDRVVARARHRRR